MLKQKLILLFTTISFILLFTACNEKTKKESTEYKIGVLKFITHPALDETERGISDYLKQADEKNLLKSQYKIEYYNANGNKSLNKQLAEKILTSGNNLTVGISTPSSQALAFTPSTTTLIYTAVSDPVGSKILNSKRATGIKNVDLHIIEKAISFLRIAFPKAQTIGTIYNPSEQNSLYVQAMIKEIVAKYNFTLIQKEVTNKSSVTQVVQSMISNIDILYSANDNTVNSTVNSIATITNLKNIPFILGDLSTLNKGATFAIGLDYYILGQKTGELISKFINGSQLNQNPPQSAPESYIYMNEKSVKNLGLQVPQNALKLIDKTIK